MLNNSLAYQIRVRQAARQLSGVNDTPSTATRSDVRSPTRTEVRSPTRTSTHATTTGNKTSTDGSYNTTTNNYAGGCACTATPIKSGYKRGAAGVPMKNGKVDTSGRLAGYKITGRIGSYRTVVGVRHALNGLGDAVLQGVPAMIPVSDRKAVDAAMKLFVAARTAGTLKGMGDTARVSGAASGASAGATVGSVIPLVGTVIGAAVGAVVGWMAGKSKPVRASAAEIAACRAKLTEYMHYAAQSPNEPIPLDYANLVELNWCINAVYGADIKLKDPRFFDGNLTDLFTMAKGVVKGIYETPIGQPVNIAATSNVVRGQTIRSAAFTFNNPVFTDLRTFNEQYFTAFAVQYCSNAAGKGASGCATLYNRPEFRRLFYDLLAYAAREVLPNISESDLKAASQLAATIPNTSARDVVSAVESILKRPVVREETAALLTTATVSPPPSTAAPNTPVTLNVPILQASAPVINLPPTPDVPSQPVSTPAVIPIAPVADPFANLPTMSSGSSSLVPVTASSTPATSVTTAGVSDMKSVYIAGALGIAAVLFATARPAKGKR